MTDTQHDDDPAVPGGQPTVEGGETVHTHPLPKWVRILAACYGVLIFLFGADVLLTIANAEDNNREQRQEIAREFDRRTEGRKAADAKIQEQIDEQRKATRTVVCDLLLNDFEPSPTVDRAIANFQCKPPTPGG